MKETNNKWEISAKRSLFKMDLPEIWRFRDLLTSLIYRDFVAFYKQTILGPIWFFLQPIFTTIIFSFVFNRLAGLSTDGIPAPLFYLAGITCWNYFSDCVTKTSTVFRDNAYLFDKVYFPRLIIPISIVSSSLIRFFVQFLLFLFFITYYAITGVFFNPNAAILLFPLLLLLMASLGLGSGLIVAALTVKYRDLSFLLSFSIQLFMYATPVILPFSAVPNKYKQLIALNPLTHILEAFKYGFLNKGTISWSSLTYTCFVTIGILTVGTVLFNKVEKTVVDTI